MNFLCHLLVSLLLGLTTKDDFLISLIVTEGLKYTTTHRKTPTNMFTVFIPVIGSWLFSFSLLDFPTSSKFSTMILSWKKKQYLKNVKVLKKLLQDGIYDQPTWKSSLFFLTTRKMAKNKVLFFRSHVFTPEILPPNQSYT